jgi:hypothetical protein
LVPVFTGVKTTAIMESGSSTANWLVRHV